MMTAYQTLQRLSKQAEHLSRARIYIALYLFSLIVVLLVGYFSHFRPSPSKLEFDEYEYYFISDQMLHGNFNISPRRTAGFPLILAAIRAVSDNFLFLQIVVAAIYAASAPMIFRLLNNLGVGVLPALLSSLLFIVWPASLYYGTSLYSEAAVLPVFLLALSVLPSPWSVPRPTGRVVLLALLSGLLLGVAAHIRPMYLLFIPVAALIILVEDQLRRIAWLKLGALVLGFAIVVLPWSMLMEARFNRMILLSANGGETLGGGLNPNLLEPSMHTSSNVGGREVWVGYGKWLPTYQTGYLSEEEQQLPYLAQDALLKDRAIKWATAHPYDAARLELYKFTYMWGIYPIAQNGPMQIIFGNVPLFFVLGLSIYLFVRVPSSRRRFIRLWILALYVTGVGLISWGSWRFRQSADMGLMAYCIACGWTLLGLDGDEARGAPAIGSGESGPPEGEAVPAV